MFFFNIQVKLTIDGQIGKRKTPTKFHIRKKKKTIIFTTYNTFFYPLQIFVHWTLKRNHSPRKNKKGKIIRSKSSSLITLHMILF